MIKSTNTLKMMISFILLFAIIANIVYGSHHYSSHIYNDPYLAQASQPVYQIIQEQQPQQQFAPIRYAPTFTRNYWTFPRASNFINRNFAYMSANSDTSNTFHLTPVQRTYVTPQTVFPVAVQSQYLGNRMLTVPTLPILANKKAKKVLKNSRSERIIVPVGTSVYRKVQYVDNITPDPAVTSIFNSWKKKLFDSDDTIQQRITSKGQAKSATTKRPKNEFDSDWSKRDSVTITPITITELPAKTNGSRVAAESEISEVKITENGTQTSTSVSDDNFNIATDTNISPEARYIELEPSNQVPLTIQFPSRTTRLNIFGGDEFFTDKSSVNGKGDLVSQSSSNGGHVLVGPDRKDEPLVLKKDGKTEIPDRMQSIIKCIFPDFRFDGDDKVRSAC